MTTICREYDFPEIYDSEYGSFEPDGPFFISLIKSSEVSLLDIACGTGRLTIPLSSIVSSTTGVDISSKMLDRAKQKGKGSGITWIKQNCTNLALDRKFDLIIMGGNSFQALLSEKSILDLFSGVCSHLNNEGTFAFNTRLLSDSIKRNVKDFKYWENFINEDGEEVQVFGRHHFNLVNSVATYQTLRLWPTHMTLSEIELIFLSADKILSLLEQAGFKVKKVCESAQGDILKKSSQNAYFTCASAKP